MRPTRSADHRLLSETRVGKRARASSIRELPEEPTDPTETVTNPFVQDQGRIRAHVTVERHSLSATLDMGASHSFVIERLARKIDNRSSQVKLADGTGRELTQALRAAVQLGEARVIISILIMPDVLNDLLSAWISYAAAEHRFNVEATLLPCGPPPKPGAPRNEPKPSTDAARAAEEPRRSRPRTRRTTAKPPHGRNPNTDKTQLHKYRKKTIEKPLLRHVQRSASAQPRGYRPVTPGRVQIAGTRQLRSLTQNWEQPRPRLPRYPPLTHQPSSGTLFAARQGEFGFKSQVIRKHRRPRALHCAGAPAPSSPRVMRKAPMTTPRNTQNHG